MHVDPDPFVAPAVRAPRPWLGRAAALAFVTSGGLAGSGACVMPAMSASGRFVTEIAIEEHYAASNDSLEVSFHGKELRRAVNLFDKHRVFGLRGTYRAAGVVDANHVVVFIRDEEDQKKVVIDNCREPRLCAFVEEAVADGLMKKAFASCRSENVCTHESER